MKGIGKTVIRGKDIETFNVEVMGILSNNKINENVLINGKSILVKVAGKVIEDAGGIAAGMSGSPIYINGKLIGGLSSGWVMTDHTVGLVTPIEEMLEIWDYPLMSKVPETDSTEKICWSPERPLLLNGRKIERIIETSELNESSVTKTADNEAVFLHAGTPIFIQGLCDKAASLLSSKFKSRQIQVAQVSTMASVAVPLNPITRQTASESLEPGSAIGVQLARGDINLTTLGTLTYKEGKKILGFAHPFLKKGNVAFLMTGAHIYHSFSSVQMPFKIGAPTDMLGIITQDREKGISGEIGRFPPMVPIQLEITDKDLKRTRFINYQIIRDPGVISTVLESTLLQAIEGVADRDGEGTALMGIALECSNTSGMKYNLRRENLFFSKTDIVNNLIDEVSNLFELVSDSEIEELYPTRLLLKIELERRRKTMTIEKVEIKNTSITPGGELEAWITLRPYREKSIVRKAKLPIPHDIGKENLTLTVFGLTGKNYETGDSTETRDRDTKSIKEKKADESSHDNFESAVRAWANGPKNSDLLFQLTVEGDELKKIKINGKDLEIQQTNLVVLGRVDTTLTLSEE